jgi:hypothetical protein
MACAALSSLRASLATSSSWCSALANSCAMADLM